MIKRKALRRLKKLLRELKKIKGRHTELVSLYIPAGSNIVDIIAQVRSEQSTAQNIKSKQTRKNVLGALEKIIQHLKQFKEVPENGLVVFSGNVSLTEGESDIRIWSLEPPEKLKTKIYWCDQEFVLEPLEEMAKEKDVFGLIVLDSKEATLGFLRGKKVEVVRHIESIVPSKTTKGGFSQMRYQRIREQALHEFLRKVGEQASKLFLEEEKLKGIIIGGPGPIKERFYEEKYLHYKLQQKVLGIKDISYTDEYGLEELVRRSEDILKEFEVMKEREVLNKFFEELKKDGLVTYGLYRVLNALKAGAIDTLIISENYEIFKVKLKCQCGYTEEKELESKDLEKQKCKNCNSIMQVIKKEDLIDILVEEAKNFGTKVLFVSNETQEGREFSNFGIGAILRFKV